jgi:hypothetical protein
VTEQVTEPHTAFTGSSAREETRIVMGQARDASGQEPTLGSGWASCHRGPEPTGAETSTSSAPHRRWHLDSGLRGCDHDADADPTAVLLLRVEPAVRGRAFTASGKGER